MKHFSLILVFIFFKLSISQSFAYNQDSLNQIDANNLKQGYWVFFGKMKKLPGYADEAKVEEGKFEDSKKMGLWKKYFPTGSIESEVTYKNNRPNGTYVTYYPNGKVQEEATWVNNKQTGTFKRYYENGNVQQEFKMNDLGKREGVQKFFYENGEIMMEGDWQDGKESGIIKEYYENGDIKAEKNFANGTLDAASTKVYEPKKPLPKEKPEELPQPAQPVIVQAGEAVNTGTFNGTGYAKLFDANKQVSKDGVFKNYKLMDGKHYQYDKNGIIQKVAIYKDGRYVGDGVLEQK